MSLSWEITKDRTDTLCTADCSLCILPTLPEFSRTVGGVRATLQLSSCTKCAAVSCNPFAPTKDKCNIIANYIIYSLANLSRTPETFWLVPLFLADSSVEPSQKKILQSTMGLVMEFDKNCNLNVINQSLQFLLVQNWLHCHLPEVYSYQTYSSELAP